MQEQNPRRRRPPVFLAEDEAKLLAKKPKTSPATPLMVAAFQGDAAITQLLSKCKKDVDFNSKEGGRTALHYAVAGAGLRPAKSAKIVEILIAAKANLDVEDFLEKSPVCYAFKKGYGEILKRMFPFLQEKPSSEHLWQAIHDLSDPLDFSNMKVTKLKVVLATKPEVNVTRSFEEHTEVTPLMLASYNLIPEAVQLLLQAKADPNATNPEGHNAFYFALDAPESMDYLSSVLRIFSLLLKAGATITPSLNGSKNLFYNPAWDCNIQMLEYLKTIGVRAEGVDGDGNTLVHILAQDIESDIDLRNIRFSSARRTFEILHSAGCRLGIVNNAGKTASQLLQERGFSILAKALLKAQRQLLLSTPTSSRSPSLFSRTLSSLQTQVHDVRSEQGSLDCLSPSQGFWPTR